MPQEILSVLGAEPTPSGKGYKFKTSEGNVWCFDPKTNRDLLAQVGGPLLLVSVDRTPGDDGKIFPKVNAFHGVSDGSSPPAAGAPQAAPTASPGQAAPGGTTPKRNGGYTADPINQVLITRQVALKAAVEIGGAEASVESVIADAQVISQWLISGLSPFILVDGINVKHVLPWDKAAAAAENAAAKKAAEATAAKLKAALEAEEAAKAAAVPTDDQVAEAAAYEADDGIPF